MKEGRRSGQHRTATQQTAASKRGQGRGGTRSKGQWATAHRHTTEAGGRAGIRSRASSSRDVSASVAAVQRQHVKACAVRHTQHATRGTRSRAVQRTRQQRRNTRSTPSQRSRRPRTLANGVQRQRQTHDTAEVSGRSQWCAAQQRPAVQAHSAESHPAPHVQSLSCRCRAEPSLPPTRSSACRAFSARLRS